MTELVSTGFSNNNLRKNVLIGLMIGVFFFFLINTTTTFSLGVPSVPLSVSSNARFFLQVIIAPIIEELVFTFVVLFLAYAFASNYFGETISFGIALFATALAFSAFHFAAYTLGGYVAGATPFISAFIFRIMAVFLNRNIGIETGIITHMAINGSIVVGQGLS